MFAYLCHQIMSAKYGITARQMLKISKKQYLISIRQKAFENHSIGPKVEPLNETSLNIFGNYIPNKKIMGAYCQSPCMNDNTKGS